ncbi:MAG TPA: response regulator transcription factor [Clostridia bacterium]|jgi:DNA-binding NarL/FixJ family response regulator|nr:response regulator transcription factor [Clostridia bacterium]
MKEKIRILVADDQVLMRDGLKTILDLEEDMEVVGTASNGKEACELAERYLPDVVLLDIRMPVMDGVAAVKFIKENTPEVKVIMLTTFDEDDYIIDAFANGADGFLLKDLNGDQLVQTVRNGATGQLILPAKVAAKLAKKVSKVLAIEKANSELLNGYNNKLNLTDREKEIATLMVNGMSNREIAYYYNLSEGTVKNYISIIYNKVGTNDRRRVITYLRTYLNAIS